MMRPMAKRFEIGDIFRMSIDARRIGFGQIVGTYERDGYYFAVFEQPHDVNETVDLELVIGGEIALLALSFDALLDRGDWEVVGNLPPPPVQWPVYREAIAPGVFEAVDYTGHDRRRIDGARRRRFRPAVSLRRYVSKRRFGALHGAAPWHEAFDRLRY